MRPCAKRGRASARVAFQRQRLVNIGDCIDHTRHSPTPHALDIENPANHGCYILLDQDGLAVAGTLGFLPPCLTLADIEAWLAADAARKAANRG